MINLVASSMSCRGGLAVMAENITDAESTIRDTDVAEEIIAYTKNNILILSAQTVLVQPNAVPQSILRLPNHYSCLKI